MITPKTIHTAVVLHDGWEMDNGMHITEASDGTRVAHWTNHNRPCLMSMKDIEDKIKETQDSLNDLQIAKYLLLAQRTNN